MPGASARTSHTEGECLSVMGCIEGEPKKGSIGMVAIGEPMTRSLPGAWEMRECMLGRSHLFGK